MSASKRGPNLTLHTYTLRLSIASPTELSDKRLAALARRFQMLLSNLGYTLWSDVEDQALHVEAHEIETLDSGC